MPVEPRYMRSDKWSITSNPVDETILLGTGVSGSVADLATSNNVYRVIASTTTGTRTVQVIYSQLRTGKIPNIKVSVEMKHNLAATTLTGTVQMYDYIAGRYAIAGEDGYFLVAITNSDQIFVKWIKENCARYRSAFGSWEIRITVTHTANFQLSLDWLEYDYTCFKLLTSNTAAAVSSEELSGYSDLGIRVFQHRSDGTESEITAGTPVATVIIPGSTTWVSATWNCPAKVLVATDAIVVRVYKYATLAWTILGAEDTFMTDDLGTTLLNATLWTVYYYFYYSAITDEIFFQWGSATRNSRIENFTWGVFAVVKVGLHPSKPLAVILSE